MSKTINCDICNGGVNEDAIRFIENMDFCDTCGNKMEFEIKDIVNKLQENGYEHYWNTIDGMTSIHIKGINEIEKPLKKTAKRK